MLALLLLVNPVVNAGDLDATADFGLAGPLSIPKAGADKGNGKPADGMNFNPAELSVLSHESIVNSRTDTVLDNVSKQRVTTTRGAKRGSNLSTVRPLRRSDRHRRWHGFRRPD